MNALSVKGKGATPYSDGRIYVATKNFVNAIAVMLPLLPRMVRYSYGNSLIELTTRLVTIISEVNAVRKEERVKKLDEFILVFNQVMDLIDITAGIGRVSRKRISRILVAASKVEKNANAWKISTKKSIEQGQKIGTSVLPN